MMRLSRWVMSSRTLIPSKIDLRNGPVVSLLSTHMYKGPCMIPLCLRDLIDVKIAGKVSSTCNDMLATAIVDRSDIAAYYDHTVQIRVHRASMLQEAFPLCKASGRTAWFEYCTSQYMQT